MSEATTIHQSPEGHRWYDHPTRRDEQGQPYRLLSVTTALEAMSKGGLPQWYANLTAMASMEQLPRLVAASLIQPCTDGKCRRCAACVTHEIAGTAAEHSKRRTEEGRAVHHVVQQWIQFDGMVIPEMNDTIRPYFDAFIQFMDDHGLTAADVLLSEAVVINDQYDYAGTLDIAITIRASASWRAAELVAKTIGWPNGRITIIIDLKTRERDTPAFYRDMGLQLIGYYNALTYLLPNGQEMPMPRLDGAAVLQVRPNGYAIQPVMCTEENFQGFLTHIQAFRWQIEHGGKICGVRSFPLPDEMQQTKAARDRITRARIADGRDPKPTRSRRSTSPKSQQRQPALVTTAVGNAPAVEVAIDQPPAPRRRQPRHRHLSVVPTTSTPPAPAPAPAMAVSPHHSPLWHDTDDIPF